MVRLIIFIFVYCLVLFFFFSKFEKTAIRLTPKNQEIREITSVRTYLEPKYNQLGFDIISLSDTREKILEATESVSVSERASGTITVFNNYSTEPQRLSPETRFKSVSGKVFKLSKEGITIPGKTSDKPGSIETRVYAEKPGPEYNIDVTDFTIPGFSEAALTEKYDNMYGLSLKPFSGGFNGERSKVGDEQKGVAINDLETELKELLIKRLEVEKTDKVLLVNNSVQIVFKEPVVEDIEKNELRLIQDAQIFALLVEKKQLEKYLRNRYLSDVSDNDVYFDDFKNIIFNYTGEELDFKNLKKIELEMNSAGSFIWNIDIQLVAESLRGLRKEDVPVILREFEEINSADIQIRPFWKKTISDTISHINFVISK